MNDMNEDEKYSIIFANIKKYKIPYILAMTSNSIFSVRMNNEKR